MQDVRKEIATLKRRLVQLEQERAALNGILSGYESLLSLGEGRDRPGRTKTNSDRRRRSKSLRESILEVLNSVGPQSLHARDILDRSQQLGATSAAKNPLAVIDLTLRGLAADGLVEKVGPRTWRSSRHDDNTVVEESMLATS